MPQSRSRRKETQSKYVTRGVPLLKCGVILARREPFTRSSDAPGQFSTEDYAMSGDDLALNPSSG